MIDVLLYDSEHEVMLYTFNGEIWNRHGVRMARVIPYDTVLERRLSGRWVPLNHIMLDVAVVER